jgi:hypothetical protein
MPTCPSARGGRTLPVADLTYRIKIFSNQD